jgi:hypothetical protein
MGYIISLELTEALDLIDYAMDQKTEELLFSRWISDIHLSMSFDEFKARLKPGRKDKRSEAEILRDVKSILELER